jgi:YD repeat-containing protein
VIYRYGRVTHKNRNRETTTTASSTAAAGDTRWDWIGWGRSLAFPNAAPWTLESFESAWKRARARDRGGRNIKDGSAGEK